MRPDPEQTLTRAAALEAGVTDFQLRLLYTGGGWRRLGHGTYVEAGRHALLSDVGQHRLAIDAILPSMASSVVVSHQSAAVLHGLPLTGVDLGKVHLTRDRRGGGRSTAGSVVHCARTDAVELLDGRRVTSVARTVVDLARTESIDTAVAVGDAAVRNGLPMVELRAELERARGTKGVGTARDVVELLDGRSESVGESLTRIRLLNAGFRNFDLQVTILGPGVGRIARVDFMIEESVVLEFDGKVKYGSLRAARQSPEDVVFDEKKREDAVRDLGYQFVRMTWSDLWDFAPVVERLERAVDRAAMLPKPVGRIALRTADPPDGTDL